MRMNNGEGGAYSKMVHLQQSTMQNDALSSPYHRREYTYHWKEMSPRTPRTPLISMRSSWQSSPAYPISSAFSMDLTHTFQMHPYNYRDDEKLKKNDYPPTSQWRLIQMSAPEWKRALLGCLGAACYGTIHPVQAYCMGTIISVYFINDKSVLQSEIRLYSCIFSSLAVLSFVANLLQHYNFAIMGESLTKRVREKMLEKLLTFEIGWFDQDDNTSAAICARLATEANMVRSLIADRMSLLVQVFFSACLAFIVGLLVAWRIAIVMIAMQPVLIASFYSKSVLMKRLSGKAKTAQSQGSQLASEATINHRTITAFCSQERTLSLFEAAMRGPRKESVKQSWFSDAGSMTSDIAKGGSAIRSVFAIIDRQSEIEPEDHDGLKVKKTFEGRIELKKVFFSYPARPDQMIFKGLSLKIEAGKNNSIGRQSGSGKSTVIGLIERFYDPQNGSVLIDERDIKSYNLKKLRSHIALVSQEPTLFAGTIRENILYGKEDATESEVRKAARLANAHEFISSMKDGYDTYCGERGVQLSGGQKQRIALARAILKDPAILLLDEATSALDSVSENQVQEALEKMMIGRTCVVVAHRLSTIQKADSIAVISNGKVVERGSHYDLLGIGRGGAYYSLIKLQNGRSLLCESLSQ
ncbi:hypothetical protein SLA2020_411400 [Shorea laevis]